MFNLMSIINVFVNILVLFLNARQHTSKRVIIFEKEKKKRENRRKV